MRAVAIALAAACASCVPLSAGEENFAKATPLCSILKGEQSFARKPVLVRARLVMMPHDFALDSPECDGLAILDLAGDGSDREGRRVVDAALDYAPRGGIPVVVSGIFQPWTEYENGREILHMWGAHIEQAHFVAARQPL